MELYFLLALSLIWSVNYLFQLKRFENYFISLSLILLSLIIYNQLEIKHSGILFYLLGLSLIPSIVSFLPSKIAIYLPFSGILPLLFLQDIESSFLDFPLLFNFKNVALIPVIFILFSGLYFIVKITLSKLIRNVDFSILFYFKILIISVISFYFAKGFGIFLVLLLLYIMPYENEKEKNLRFNISGFLFAFILLKIQLFELSIEENIILDLASVLSLFSVFLLHSFQENKTINAHRYFKLINLFLPVLLIFILFKIDAFKEHIGGNQAIILVILFYSVIKLNKSSSLSMASIFILLTSSYLMFQKPNKIYEEIPKIGTLKDKTTPIQATSIEIIAYDSILGKYNLTNKNVNLQFELGPKSGRTKGIFKEIKGSINFLNEISLSSINVEIPVKSISTFNKYRDDAIMEASFFNEKVYPKIKFKSFKLTSNNNSLEIEGILSMKDQQKEIKLNGQFIKKEGKKRFIATCSFNRTDFNMESDPKIGDIVDLSIEVVLD